MSDKLKFSEEHIVLREATSEDFNYIKSSWLRSSRKNPEFKYMKDEVFYPNHGIVVGDILYSSQQLVVSYVEDPKIIIGYIVFEIDEDFSLIVHWASVKNTFRKMGIYNHMLDNALQIVQLTAQDDKIKYYFTHLPSEDYGFMCHKEFKRRGFLYNPYLRSRDIE